MSTANRRARPHRRLVTMLATENMDITETLLRTSPSAQRSRQHSNNEGPFSTLGRASSAMMDCVIDDSGPTDGSDPVIAGSKRARESDKIDSDSMLHGECSAHERRRVKMQKQDLGAEIMKLTLCVSGVRMEAEPAEEPSLPTFRPEIEESKPPADIGYKRQYSSITHTCIKHQKTTGGERLQAGTCSACDAKKPRVMVDELEYRSEPGWGGDCGYHKMRKSGSSSSSVYGTAGSSDDESEDSDSGENTCGGELDTWLHGTAAWWTENNR